MEFQGLSEENTYVYVKTVNKLTTANELKSQNPEESMWGNDFQVE